MATRSMKEALLWLINRNGTGVFERNAQVLVAAGERAPIMRSTWTRLLDAGLVESLERSRITVTEEGFAVDMVDICESLGTEFVNQGTYEERGA
jgi:hypothetical protein